MPTEPSRSVVITGAAGGIGVALCSAFSEAGYRVIAVDRGFPAACIAQARNPAVQVTADLEHCCGDQEALAELLSRVREALGPGGLHALVNNAAVQVVRPTDELTVADWERTLRTNVTAPFVLTQSLLSDLQKASGSVINMASIHAIATKPGFVAYATSKSALVGLTRAMAVDLGGRVRVNAILPAAVATPMLLAGFEGRAAEFEQLGQMHPIGRVADPSEIAGVAVFLASADAGFVTGSAWQVDGGIGARLHDPV